MDIFLKVLYIATVTTCGISGRTTETTSLKFVNTMNGDRNMYLEDGQFMFVTEYHKSQAIMDIPKVEFILVIQRLTIDHSEISSSTRQSSSRCLSNRRHSIPLSHQSGNGTT